MKRRFQVAAAVVAAVAFLGLGATAVEAQRHYHGGYRGSAVFVGGYFYDPFWGPYPWWPAAAYPYPYYPAYYDGRAEIRVLVTPKEAAVYVDGFYAGIVDDFDGWFQRLPVSPGGHDLVLYMPGYRTVHQSLYAAAASSLKVQYAMEKLAAGDTSEPPPEAPPVPPPPDGSAVLPPTRVGAPPLPNPPAPQPGAASGFGTLVVRAQPGDAVIAIDGEPWTPSDARAGLTLQMAEGRHRVEIRKTGFKPYSAEVVVRAGESTPLNVSLSPE